MNSSLSLTPEQKSWLAVQALKPENINPCVRLYGIGPVTEKCKDCTLFVRRVWRNKEFFKCQLRSITGGAETDHQDNWPACGRFERKKK